MGKSLCAWIGGATMWALSLYSHAAGLGSLEVKSVLGEPLRAEVAVSATPAEIPSLAARLASPGAYEAAGLVYSGIVSQLAVTLNKSGSVPVLTITSAGPINEPVVDLLLELSWSSGRVSREYTAFIDPPFIVAERERRRVQEAMAEAEAQAADAGAETRAANLPDAPTPQPLPEVPDRVRVTSPDAAMDEPIETETVSAPEAVAVEPVEETVVEETVLAPVETIGGTDATLFGAAPSSSLPADEPMMADETMTADTAARTATREPVPGKPIGVIRGDTLSKIALAHKPAGVTLEQMLVVLFRNNPDAFSANNMNRLRTGKIIRLGDPNEYRSVDQAQALKEVRVQYGDFKTYRARVAEAAMQRQAGEQPAQQAAAGTVTPKMDEGGAASAKTPSDVVKLSRGEPAAGGQTGAGQAQTRALEEKLVASEKALKESNARVARLEKIIEDLQKLAEVQSQDMAKLQSQAASTAQAPAATPKPAPTPPSPPKPTGEVKPAPDKPAAAQQAATAPETPAKPDQPAGGEPTAPPAAAAGQATAQAPAPAPVPTAPTSEPAAAPAPAPAAQRPARRAPPPPPPPAPTLLDQVLEQPYLLAVPIVVLLLVGLGVSRLRGRKREPKSRSEEVAPATAAAGAAAAAASKPGTFSPADTDVGIGSTDTGGGEEVDPLEEAEIFLAYGRDAQAEELLKEALTTHPARFEIHAKLAEIYAKRSDKDAFEELAKQVQQGTGGEGEIWDRVVKLGYSIDPDNPRYAEGVSDDVDDDDEKTVVMRSSDITSTADRLDFEVGAGDSADSGAPDFDPSATTEFEASPIVDPEATMEGPIDDDDVETMKIDMAEAGLTATDLDLNAELPELDSDKQAEPSQTDTVGFDEAVPSFPETSEPEEDSGLDFNIEGISLDSDSEQQKTMEQAQETVPDMPALDLSGITLDMDGATTATQAGSSGKDEKWYEVQTKFDLAKAYQEMGDNDGAKEILQEVITEGDSEQKAAAESVLASLD